MGDSALTSGLYPRLRSWLRQKTSTLIFRVAFFSLVILLLLLVCGDVHPHPGPPTTNPPNILQFNVNGISKPSKKKEIADFLSLNDVKIACIQETKLRATAKSPSFNNYASVRRDRPNGGGGGLLLLVHVSVSYTPLDVPDSVNDGVTEALAVTASLGGKSFRIINIYIPPASSCPAGYAPDFADLLSFAGDDALVLGDFNAHHSSWFSNVIDARGISLLDAIDASSFSTLNENSPTRIPVAANSTPSSPDVSICSTSLLSSLSWTAPVRLSSDHLPLLISLIDVAPPPPRPRRSFSNLRRADWRKFTEELESLIPPTPPSSAYVGEKVFREAFSTSAKHNIPAGFRRDFDPRLPPAVHALQAQRDDLRESDPQDPAIADLDHQISSAIDAHARERWEEELADSDSGTNPLKFWALFRRCSGKRTYVPPNQPILFKNDKIYTKHSSIARAFNKQFSCVGVHKSSKETRGIIREIRKRRLDPTFSPFRVEDTLETIRSIKNSTAIGPDGMSNTHLKHLGPRALSYITATFNLSIAHAQIPSIWKKSHILPVLKPNKPPNLSTSYRPISLLCPLSKLLERLLLPFLTDSLPSSPSQHGFKRRHSTVTALLPLVTCVARGFNQVKPPLRSAVVSTDISKAFEVVDHNILLRKLTAAPLHNNVLRWMSAFVRGRQSAVTYQGSKSTYCIVKTGVAQGSVSGPILFNTFVEDCPNEDADEEESYADDFDFLISDPKWDDILNRLQPVIDSVVDWTSSLNLTIAPSKSFITLFTPDTHESHKTPLITIDLTPLPLDCRPKLLGVTFDTHLTFTPHVDRIIATVHQKTRLLRALAGSSWGSSKESLITLFKAYVAPSINYGAPIWFPNASPSAIARLQRAQNKALRVITGCHSSASSDHLHQETLILPVSEHLSLLCAQFLSSCLRPNHPSFRVANLDSGPRAKKHTLRSKFLPVVAPYLNADGHLDPPDYGYTIKQLHTQFVANTISSLEPNPVIGFRPPKIHLSEATLPRRVRCALSQLRSGDCHLLASTQVKYGRSQSSLCPDCRFARQTTSHLFSCDAVPTNLNTRDLWKRPTLVAEHLVSFSNFQSLIPPDPPLRPPPPASPPPARPPPEPPP